MSVMFVEGRGLPASIRKSDMGHYLGARYGDAGTDIANTARNISPWDFLTGIFVTKPAQAAQAQAEIAAAQAQSAAISAQERQSTLRTAMLAGAGVLGLLALVAVVRRPAAHVGGYRKSRRTRRSRR